MEEEILESSVDLTPVLEVMEQMREQLAQQTELSGYILLGVFAFAGVVVGCSIAFMLRDLWR